jgi:hypothetical protein
MPMHEPNSNVGRVPHTGNYLDELRRREWGFSICPYEPGQFISRSGNIADGNKLIGFFIPKQ